MPNQALELLNRIYPKDSISSDVFEQLLAKRPDLNNQFTAITNPFLELLNIDDSKLTNEEREWLYSISITVKQGKQITLSLMQLWLLVEHQVFIHGDTWDSGEQVLDGLRKATSKDISIQVPALESRPKALLSLITRHSLNFSDEADKHPFAKKLQLLWETLAEKYSIFLIDQERKNEASARDAEVMQLWNKGVPFFVVKRSFPLEGDWQQRALDELITNCNGESERYASCIVKGSDNEFKSDDMSFISALLIAPTAEVCALYKSSDSINKGFEDESVEPLNKPERSRSAMTTSTNALIKVRSYPQDLMAIDCFQDDETTTEDISLQLQLGQKVGDVVGVIYHPESKAIAEILWYSLSQLQGRPAALFTYDTEQGLQPFVPHKLGFQLSNCPSKEELFAEVVHYKGFLAWYFICRYLEHATAADLKQIVWALTFAFDSQPQLVPHLIGILDKFAGQWQDEPAEEIRALFKAALTSPSPVLNSLVALLTHWEYDSIVKVFSNKNNQNSPKFYFLQNVLNLHPEVLPSLLTLLRKCILPVITGVFFIDYDASGTLNLLQDVAKSQPQVLESVVQFIAQCYIDYSENNSDAMLQFTGELSCTDAEMGVFLNALLNDSSAMFFKFADDRLANDDENSEFMTSYMPHFLLDNNAAALLKLVNIEPQQLGVLLTALSKINMAQMGTFFDSILQAIAQSSQKNPRILVRLKNMNPLLFVQRVCALYAEAPAQTQIVMNNLWALANPNSLNQNLMRQLIEFIKCNKSFYATVMSSFFYCFAPTSLEQHLVILIKHIAEDQNLQENHLRFLKTVLQDLKVRQKNDAAFNSEQILVMNFLLQRQELTALLEEVNYDALVDNIEELDAKMTEWYEDFVNYQEIMGASVTNNLAAATQFIAARHQSKLLTSEIIAYSLGPKLKLTDNSKEANFS